MDKAVYPGSFDPITNGHIDIIVRSSRFFDELVVAVVDNPSKKCLFTLEERRDIVFNVISNIKTSNKISVVTYSGLLVSFVKNLGSSLIIRGLRALSDFDYELKFTMMNRSLEKDIEIMYLMTDQKDLFVSSSILKEVAFLGGDISEHMPKYAFDKLMEKVKNLNI